MLNIFKTLGLVVVSSVLSCIALEVYVRSILDDGLNYELEMWKYARLMKQVSDDPYIGHEHRPNSKAHLMGVDVSINSTKLRDREVISPKGADTIRLLMLGDSITFGWGVESSDTVAKKIEEILRKSYPGKQIEVINAGVGNYNTAMEVNWFLSHGASLEPDAVILNYFVNDAELTPRRQGGFFREYSAAFIFLSARIDQLIRQYFGGNWLDYYTKLYAPDSPGWMTTQKMIRELAANCKTSNTELMIVSYPELHQLRPYPFRIVIEELATLANDLDIKFIDLLPSVEKETPRSLWVTPDDAHPSAKTNQRYANYLSSEMNELIIPSNSK